ncbi:MAG TPA: tRNA glutamyl-Q(34) synthetase GluQRS [Usitatibacter sp.]|nr:tRNA glutamyl-Q(34) synthetase GluQRS [Usitatibacter sp.]
MTSHGRFAPSPTGPLHFGSLVAALASWLDARAAGGRWSVRIEDVDAPRTVPGAADEILRTLEACALEWDGEVTYQSARGALYEAALQRLRAAGRVYRCRCTRREIVDSGLAGIEGAVYPGTCRDRVIPADAACAWRFRVAPGSVAFDDRVQGTIVQDVAREVGDFVLRRRDGLYAYQLAVVVDDADQGVTDVVRGADLLASTPRQIQLQRTLGIPTPRYLHFPVATDARGGKLSKQNLAPALDGARAAARLAAALAFLGQEVPQESSPRALLREAVRRWSAGRIPRASAVPVAEGVA